jgi:hypothetical protein
MYVGDHSTAGIATFGHTTHPTPRRKYVSGPSYASNPWMIGIAPRPPQRSSFSELLEEYMRGKSEDELTRFVKLDHYITNKTAVFSLFWGYVAMAGLKTHTLFSHICAVYG